MAVIHKLHPSIRRLTSSCFKYGVPSASSLSERWLSISALSDNQLRTIDEVREVLVNSVGTRSQWGSDELVAGKGAIMQPIATSQTELPRRKPLDSYAQALIPLGRNEQMREKYLTSKRNLRFGRILEDFDSMAGLICYKHNEDPTIETTQKSPYACVTALVDRIEIDPENTISAMKDIYIEGNVTWVGRSSLECTMHMSQDNGDTRQRLITAQYLFVARNPLTQKAAVVSPLDPQTEEDKELFRKGEEAKARRIAEGEKSLLKVPPSKEERLMIHDLFLSTIDLDSGSLRVRVKPDNTVWMEDTVLKTLIICQPQQRNLYNKIFGGFLMRKAYELAWTSASLHAQTHSPMCRIVDDIVFRRPVEIGSLLFLSSQIVYTNGGDLQIKVHAEVVDPETNHRESTNDFHFTFNTGVSDLKQVLPKTYAESMLYVDGKRHYES